MVFDKALSSARMELDGQIDQIEHDAIRLTGLRQAGKILDENKIKYSLSNGEIVVTLEKESNAWNFVSELRRLETILNERPLMVDVDLPAYSGFFAQSKVRLMAFFPSDVESIEKTITMRVISQKSKDALTRMLLS